MESSSQASTVPGSPSHFPSSLQSCTPTEIEEEEVEHVESSSTDVELVTINMVPKLPTAEEELKLMQEHEKFGHLYRIRDHDAAWQAKVEEVRRFFASESPEAKRARRQSFQRVVYGMHS